MTRRVFHLINGAMLIVLLGALMMSQTVMAQEKGIEIGGTYSYMWAGTVHFYQGEIQMEDASQWGGFASFSLRPDTKLELSYLNSRSNATYFGYPNMHQDYPQLNNVNSPVTIQYFQAGSIYQIDKGKAAPFFGVYAGAAYFHPTGTAPKGVTYNDQWFFAMSFAGGVKIYASDKFGIRLQGRLLLPMYFSGGSMYVGTGGAGVAVGAGIPIVQGDVGVGIFLRI
jgi:hypothetical protein